MKKHIVLSLCYVLSIILCSCTQESGASEEKDIQNSGITLTTTDESLSTTDSINETDLEKAIRLSTDFLSNKSCGSFLYDFNVDGIPELICIQPNGEFFDLECSVYNLRGSDPKCISTFYLDEKYANSAEITKYYDTKTDSYFYVTEYEAYGMMGTYSDIAEMHKFYSNTVKTAPLAQSDFYKDNSQYYMYKNIVNYKDVGFTGFINENDKMSGKKYYYDALNTYLSDYEKVETIVFTPITMGEDYDWTVKLKDFDKKYSNFMKTKENNIHDSEDTIKFNGEDINKCTDKLSIELKDDYENIDFSKIKEFPNLTSVDIWSPNENDVNFDISSIVNNHNITTLQLGYEVNVDLNKLAEMTWIKNLKLGNKIDNLDCVQNMTSLETIYLGYFNKDKKFFEPLYDLKKLKVIAYNGQQHVFTSEQYKSLSEHLPGCIFACIK